MAPRDELDQAVEDYENLERYVLDDDEIAKLTAETRQCVFNWTTKDGFPVGVIVAYVYKDGKLWTTSARHRKRISALRKRPQSAVVIENRGKTVTYKGNSVIHDHDDPDWAELSGWFYDELSGVRADPTNRTARAFRRLLDSENRVIISTELGLVAGFDATKFWEATQAVVEATADRG